MTKVYDLAAHHNNPESKHVCGPECEQVEGDTSVSQFLRCLKAELDRIRTETAS